MVRLLAIAAFLALLTSPLWLAMLALDPLPRVLGTTSLSVDDVENAKRLLRETTALQKVLIDMKLHLDNETTE